MAKNKLNIQPVETDLDIEPIADPQGVSNLPVSVGVMDAEGSPKYSAAPEPRMYLQAAPEPSLLEKYKKYFTKSPFREEAPRWSKPTRHEKFYKAFSWPLDLAYKLTESGFSRLNKFATNIMGLPSKQRAITEANPKELYGTLEDTSNALSALVPVLGYAKDAPTYGESLAKNWYEPLTGQEAPWWYQPLNDVALETLLLGGMSAKRALLARQIAKFGNRRLASTEIKAAKRIFTKRAISQMQPSEVRMALVKESTTFALSKTEKARLISMGYKPTQIQSMTPLDAHEILGSITKAESAAGMGYSGRVTRAIDNLTVAVKKAKRLYPSQKRAISKEKGRRVAIAAKKAKEGPGIEQVRKSAGALKGEYPVPAFESPQINPTDIAYLDRSLYNAYLANEMPYFRYLDTSRALHKVLGGEITTPSETSLLQRHFGAGLAKQIMAKRELGTKAWEFVLDLANLPRATLASFDMSFPLRQGSLLLPGHPKQWGRSFLQMLKASIPGKKGRAYARYYEKMAESSRYSSLRHKAGLEITEWGLPNPAVAEEMYQSRLAERIPLIGKGIQWSERAYTTMSNQLRVNVFDDIARNWESAGITWETHPEAYTKLASFLNHATGRGTLKAGMAVTGKAKDVGWAPSQKWLNAVFFSPRYQISRPQVIYDAVSATVKGNHARKIIAGDTIKFVSTGMAVLGLASLLPDVEVETDPRSSDFGKIRYGNTRWNFWSGYQQIARYTAQLITKQAKTTGTDKTYEINRAQTVARLLRMKASPTAGFVWDILQGQTPMGERLAFEPTNISKQAYERTAPLVWQEIIDAARFQGMDSALPLTSTTAFFGVGSNTWEPSKYTMLALEQDRLAQEYFGTEWENLTGYQQKELRRDNQLLRNLKREADYERTSFPFIEEMKREQLEAGNLIQEKLPDPVKEEMKKLNVRVGSLPRTWGKWTLNDERYKSYKNHIKTFLDKRLTSVLETEAYQNRNKEQQTMLIESIISAAKARAKSLVRKESHASAPERISRERP